MIRSFKKDRQVRLRVTTSDSKWLGVTPSDKLQQVTTSNYKWLRARLRVATTDSEYEWLQVNASDYKSCSKYCEKLGFLELVFIQTVFFSKQLFSGWFNPFSFTYDGRMMVWHKTVFFSFENYFSSKMYTIVLCNKRLFSW